jgi:AraC family transcriptional regulator of adaptative response / DNA-3-methyladenine glycosylase II
VSDFIIKAVEMIEQGYLDEHTTQELAQELFVSECHLRRQFRNELGISPVKAAMNRRLSKACVMIRQTDMRLIDIAFESGFNSLRSFNHAFQTVYHLAPSQMRKRWV